MMCSDVYIVSGAFHTEFTNHIPSSSFFSLFFLFLSFFFFVLLLLLRFSFYFVCLFFLILYVFFSVLFGVFCICFTSDIIKLGVPVVLTYLTNIFNNILKTKQIPDSWHEAKIVILFKKGDPKDINNYRPIRLLSHSYKIFTRLLQTRIERTLDENQPREQAGFLKGYSTTDHLQALNQIIEKSNEYNLPLCIGFIDYEKAFDTVEHFAIFEALRKTNVNETYIFYKTYTTRASVHLDKLVSTEFPIHRGVRQGDPLSPKLFTAVMEEVFKKADISEGVNVDGENLTNLRFADDVALFNETTKQMEKHLNNLNSESLKV